MNSPFVADCSVAMGRIRPSQATDLHALVADEAKDFCNAMARFGAARMKSVLCIGLAAQTL
jgi:hypothetical protein